MLSFILFCYGITAGPNRDGPAMGTVALCVILECSQAEMARTKTVLYSELGENIKSRPDFIVPRLFYYCTKMALGPIEIIYISRSWFVTDCFNFLVSQ